jgi:hypothetical protein
LTSSTTPSPTPHDQPGAVRIQHVAADVEVVVEDRGDDAPSGAPAVGDPTTSTARPNEAPD